MMNETKAREIFNYLLKDHNLDKFFEFCTDDIKFVLHPKHVAAGIYDKKSIYGLFEHLAKSFPNWSEVIEEVYHDKEKKFVLLFQKEILQPSLVFGIFKLPTMMMTEKYLKLKIA